MNRLAVAILLTLALFGCDRFLKLKGSYCDSSADCPADRPECDTIVHACYAPPPLECTTSTECTDEAKPICDASGSCRACDSAADNAACTARQVDHGACALEGTNTGRCVACPPSTAAMEDSACASATPVCEVDGSCRQCATNHECVSLVCEEGLCVSPNKVAYVDNAQAACSNDAHASTPSEPYCGLLEAITSSPGFSHILVAGSTTPYGPAAVFVTASNPASLKILGPGMDANPPATIASPDFNAVDLATSGGAAQMDVTLEGFVISAGALNVSRNAVGCTLSSASSSAQLHLRRNRVSAYGVCLYSTGCAITVEQNVFDNCGLAALGVDAGTVHVESNRFLFSGKVGDIRNVTDFSFTRNFASRGATGLEIFSTAHFRIENNFFLHFTAGGAIYLFGSANGAIRFNTVVDNLRIDQSAITCTDAGGPVHVEASLFFGNTSMSGFPTENCIVEASLADIQYPMNMGNGLIGMPFVDPAHDDYHLVAGSAAQDLLSNLSNLSSGPLPTIDFDGDPRPRASSSGYDVGADQAVP